jgi:hypothetical protein
MDEGLQNRQTEALEGWKLVAQKVRGVNSVPLYFYAT